ncbi:MAG: hypothetical protein JW701_01095 [Kosmotogaceae bacterium]|nr:hypothetical protein [Kosmotogaceae bacterium]
MSVEENKLDELEAQAAESRDKRNELYEKIKKIREERDRLNNTARATREQAHKHRDERDRVNAKVQEIKQNLGPLFEELDEKNQALAKADKLIKEDYKGLPSKKKVQEALRQIEWEVMTTPTKEMLGREDELIQRASKLRRTLDEFKGIEQKQDKKLDHLADKKAVEIEISALREEINKLAEQSQEHHERMILLYDQADKDQEKADQTHTKYVEKIQEVESIKEELNLIMSEIKAIRDGLKAHDNRLDELRKMNTEQRAEALKQAALKKLESGEKLSFEDLKLIYGDEDDEEEIG